MIRVSPIYYRRLGPIAVAVLDVCELDLTQEGVPEGTLWIPRVNVPPAYRGQGIGSELLRECCADADATGTDLCLAPSSSGEMSDAELEAWYARYGFKRHGAELKCGRLLVRRAEAAEVCSRD